MRRAAGCFIAIALIAWTEIQGGTPPRAGWRKGDLFTKSNATSPPIIALPNATDAARLSVDVPFDFVETYADRYLISVAIDHINRLRELATPLLMTFLEHDNYDKVLANDAWVDTRYPLSVPTNGLPDANYAPGQPGVYLIQFHGPEKPEWIQQIHDLGAVVLRSQPVNGYFIAATPEIAARVAAEPYVQWSTPLHPYLKFRAKDSTVAKGLPVSLRVARLPGSDAIVERVLDVRDTWDVGNVTYAWGILKLETLAPALEEPLVLSAFEDCQCGSGGGGPAQIPTMSTWTLMALALALAAIALRR